MANPTTSIVIDLAAEPGSLAVPVERDALHRLQVSLQSEVPVDGRPEAGTLDREAVIAELESGTSFDGPKGTVLFDGASHHLIQPASLARTNDSNGFEVFETFESVPPSWEQETCDLITNPDINEQFTPGDN